MLPELRDPMGLEVDPGLPLASWALAVRRVAVIKSATKWWAGDLIVQSALPEEVKYQVVCSELHVTPRTVAVIEWVARRISRERRRRELSWSQHKTVAGVPPGEQSEWLERCVRARWSVHRLEDEVQAARAAVRAGRPDAPTAPLGRPPRPPAQLSRLVYSTSTGGYEAVQMRLFAPPEKVERWQAASVERGLTFLELVEEALDAYVAAKSLVDGGAAA